MAAALIRKLEQAEQRLRNGDAPGARSLVEQVLRSAPRNPQALFLLGISHLSMGAPSNAVPALQLALRTEPRNGAILEHLGLAHLLLGQFAAAEKVLSDAVRLPRAPASAGGSREGGTLKYSQ